MPQEMQLRAVLQGIATTINGQAKPEEKLRAIQAQVETVTKPETEACPRCGSGLVKGAKCTLCTKSQQPEVTPKAL